MKNKHTIVMGLVLVLLIVWFWQRNKTQVENANTLINTTGKESVVAPKEKTETREKVKKVEQTPVSIAEWEIPAVGESNDERTYLAVYYDLRFSQRCHQYYKDEHKKESAFNFNDYFLERIITPPLVTSYDPTEAQLATFREFIQACNSLKKTTFIRAGIEQRYPTYNDQYPVVTELKKELEQTIAKTEAERSLEQVLKMKKQWNELLNALMVESKGEFVMTEEERKEAQNEMMSLAEESMSLTEGEELDTEEVMAVANRLQELNDAMQETTGANDETRAQLLVEFEALEVELRRYLQSEHIDTFLVAMSALEFAEGFDLRVAVGFGKFQFKEIKKYIPEYISPSQVLSEMSGIADKPFYDSLVVPASILYLCQRGYDCSDTSELVTDFCWGPADRMKMMSAQMHPQACGLTVKNFIENYFMTKNQNTDVHSLLKLMGEIYAP